MISAVDPQVKFRRGQITESYFSKQSGPISVKIRIFSEKVSGTFFSSINQAQPPSRRHEHSESVRSEGGSIFAFRL
ncbi:MAG: hypothetical protein ACKN9U_26200, partial [Pirellulaceae bacterium]